MTSEERAQETFRSLATEAVNTIMDALDMLGDFAPLHKNEMYDPEVDECFNAIAEYLERTKKKYERDEKRKRFTFASERSKRADLGVDREIPVKTEKTPRRAYNSRKIELYEDGGFVGVFNTAQEVADLIGCTISNVCKSTKTGRPIQGKYTVKRTGGNVNELRDDFGKSFEGINGEGTGDISRED